MKINGYERITDSPHLNLFSVGYHDKTGRPREWQVVSRGPEPKLARTNGFQQSDAVVIVPMHTENRCLVIIKEFRVPLGGYQYGFPAGLIDPGESVEAAAKRELDEETGLLLTDIDRISPPVYSSSGLTDESVTMVFGRCNGTPSNRGNENSEDITTLMVSPATAADLCRDATLKLDVKTWLVLSTYAVNGNV